MVCGPKEVEGHVGCILTEARYLKTDLVKGENVSRLMWIANNNDNTSVTGFQKSVLCHNIRIKEELPKAVNRKQGGQD